MREPSRVKKKRDLTNEKGSIVRLYDNLRCTLRPLSQFVKFYDKSRQGPVIY